MEKASTKAQTQALVHELRGPFLIFRNVINELLRGKHPSPNVLKNVVQELNRWDFYLDTLHDNGLDAIPVRETPLPPNLS